MLKSVKSVPSGIPSQGPGKEGMGDGGTTLLLKKPDTEENCLCNEFKMRIIPNREEGSGLKQNPYFIFEPVTNDVRTPKPLRDTEFHSISDRRFTGLSVARPLTARTDRSGIPGSLSATSLHSMPSMYTISHRSVASLTPTIHSMGVLSLGEISFSAIAIPSEEEVRKVLTLGERVPSMFRLREDPPPRVAKIPTEFKVTLTETETVFMLVIPTQCDSPDTGEGRKTLKDNQLHEFNLQVNKTLSHIATQTHQSAVKNSKVNVPRNDRANSSAYATSWDIYDTYEDLEKKRSSSVVGHDDGFRKSTTFDLAEMAHEEEYMEEFYYLGHKFNVRLLNALMIMERLIAKKKFREEQLVFQGLLVQDPFSLSFKCNYSLTYLWTFSYAPTQGRTVTSICWSPKIENVLAVGYGKFKYSDHHGGHVCIWNVKNPQEPERYFGFKDPVTCVTFSEFRPQILAVTFYNGLVMLIDIIGRSLMTKASNRHYPLYYPVWQAVFYPHEPLQSGQFLMTCTKSGKLYNYRKTKFMMSKQMMSMGRPHGRIQGVHQMRRCFATKTPSCRNPSAEVIVLHPADPMLYLVGTSEGCVYLCSVNHRHDHVEVFLAHDGPIYNIQFNPFCSKVFLTCGADWCIRIWAEGIYDPLVTLESGMISVQSALWSPLHSTVVVSITGAYVEMWDLRRKTVAPKSCTLSPTNCMNTAIAFSRNRYNLSLGDVDGNVHILGLSEMPFSPSFQEEVLAQSLRNCLIAHPQLLDRLLKLGYPFAQQNSNLQTKLYHKLDNLQKCYTLAENRQTNDK
ncbi:WD repeat-containing protein 78 [Homalodisca vitripennis]|nr:WD repeat-containing protein 78 [Homalodisca vitripennis]